jgi:hypothetical protein
MSKPLFETLADATLDKVRDTYAQRGQEYSDTWASVRFVQMEATAKALGLKISQEQCRSLALAALVDIKYWRSLGGYKEDNTIDGIAYAAAHASDMRKKEKTLYANKT